MKKTTAVANDIVVVKNNNELIYWGIIDEIQNEDGNYYLFDRLDENNNIRYTGFDTIIYLNHLILLKSKFPNREPIIIILSLF